ncbi:hypothetical protein N9D66_01980 [Candidatus Nanopelagicales bacterium]|nr:hypothetical protein [Candidatus Nanopelagicales bacterium]
MTASLQLAMDERADALLSNDAFALMCGMLLDQQFPMERAFAGPSLLAERLGDGTVLDPAAILAMDTDDLINLAKGPPAIHRYPGSMAKRIQQLAGVVASDYDGDAAQVWRSAETGLAARKALEALPGFGAMKSRIFLALVGKQLGEAPVGWQEAAAPYGDAGITMSIADVVDRESLDRVRSYKKQKKAAAKAG